jgi:hypothetical protein
MRQCSLQCGNASNTHKKVEEVDTNMQSVGIQLKDVDENVRGVWARVLGLDESVKMVKEHMQMVIEGAQTLL